MQVFKILVLQRMCNLSGEQAEYQIVDCTSFRDLLVQELNADGAYIGKSVKSVMRKYQIDIRKF